MSAPPNPGRAVSSRVFLMYHELELPNRRLCDSVPGYVRYVVTKEAFEEQIRWLKSQGWRGMSISDFFADHAESGVVLTFDDGAESDILAAAPVLAAAGFGATFYITTGFLGRPGYLSRIRLRELSDLGFDIGCHSATHPYLTDIPEANLAEEIAAPKTELEQITGRQVQHFSCPGGRWSPRIAMAAQQAGYRSVATSRTAANLVQSDPFSLGRVAIMRETSLNKFEQLCRARGFWKLELMDIARATAKRLFGNSTYDRIRSVLLHRSSIE